MLSGATRRDRTGDLLITKKTYLLQALQWLHADRFVINKLGILLSHNSSLSHPNRIGFWLSLGKACGAACT
jgi:hypothetical protein